MSTFSLVPFSRADAEHYLVLHGWQRVSGETWTQGRTTWVRAAPDDETAPFGFREQLVEYTFDAAMSKQLLDDHRAQQWRTIVEGFARAAQIVSQAVQGLVDAAKQFGIKPTQQEQSTLERWAGDDRCMWIEYDPPAWVAHPRRQGPRALRRYSPGWPRVLPGHRRRY